MIKPDQPRPRGDSFAKPDSPRPPTVEYVGRRSPPPPPPMRCPADYKPIASLEALIIPATWTLLVLVLGILIGIRSASVGS